MCKFPSLQWLGQLGATVPSGAVYPCGLWSLFLRFGVLSDPLRFMAIRCPLGASGIELMGDYPVLCSLPLVQEEWPREQIAPICLKDIFLSRVVWDWVVRMGMAWWFLVTWLFYMELSTSQITRKGPAYIALQNGHESIKLDRLKASLQKWAFLFIFGGNIRWCRFGGKVKWQYLPKF